MSFLNWFSRKPPRNAALPPAASQLRDARIDRRERLYAVVRTSLVQAGVQTSSFKFKVLALDDQGHQFLVMVDVANPWGGDAGWRARIETQVIEAAQAQHGLVITSVYWRNNAELVAAPPSVPATLSGPESGPSDRVTLTGGVGRYEPLQEDEVVAFQKALEAASRLPSVSGKIH
ncbi:hypothetical protein [Rhodoferax sp. WC2427]|uniref:hypothetical protein n=1 Tax=Rhodoferax sp. WC2427 TaxID=3234144 RepID=UPI003467E8FC